MWWGGQLAEISEIVEPRKSHGEPRTFNVPEKEFENINENIELMGAMEGKLQAIRSDLDKCTFALPDGEVRTEGEPEIDPFVAFDRVVPHPRSDLETEYWSVDENFWAKWKEEQSSAKVSSSRDASALFAAAKRAAEAQAAAAVLAAAERAKREELEKMKAKKAELPQRSVVPSTVQVSQSVPTDIAASFKNLMENGKKFRSEFMPIWREISLAVSTTACNVRSIQMNATKLVNALARASAQAGPNRQDAIHWLASVCGSKIVSQASSGNKSLVWSFAYLLRIVADKFPDVSRVGAMGEIAIACPRLLPSQQSSTDTQPQDMEAYARVWAVIMCVSCDETTLWSWACRSINALNNMKSFSQSMDALWHMMFVYILFDVGLYDFRRIFGSQAMFLVEHLEKSVFPRIDSQLQCQQQSTASSVQLRFYLDACYNIIQSRKYLNPPEGRTLAAAKESELNPDM
jgi:hypothetical protein